ncbi:MAG: cytochrome C [Nitrospirae bacterium]|nr:cytochrome C [Nitrospirota bacterium]
MNNRQLKISIIVLLLAAPAFLYHCAGHSSVYLEHPVEIERPICSECHIDEHAAMSHTSDFLTRHKFYAARWRQACSLCHRESFCNDCHANKEELKPSDKFKDSPDRSLPHRGDYLTQHTIDGRINPAPCFKCHGRKNNERCGACHR